MRRVICAYSIACPLNSRIRGKMSYLVKTLITSRHGISGTPTFCEMCLMVRFGSFTNC